MAAYVNLALSHQLAGGVYSGHVRRNLSAESPALKPPSSRNVLAVVLASAASLAFQRHTFGITPPFIFPGFEGNGE
jgi:hypothetical protein